MRKGLHITSSDFGDSLEDHDEDDVEGLGVYETQSCHTSKMQVCRSNSHDAPVSLGKVKYEARRETLFVRFRTLNLRQRNSAYFDHLKEESAYFKAWILLNFAKACSEGTF